MYRKLNPGEIVWDNGCLGFPSTSVWHVNLECMNQCGWCEDLFPSYVEVVLKPARDVLVVHECHCVTTIDKSCDH